MIRYPQGPPCCRIVVDDNNAPLPTGLGFSLKPPKWLRKVAKSVIAPAAVIGASLLLPGVGGAIAAAAGALTVTKGASGPTPVTPTPVPVTVRPPVTVTPPAPVAITPAAPAQRVAVSSQSWMVPAMVGLGLLLVTRKRGS